MYFTIEKIERRLHEIKTTIYRDHQEIEHFKYEESEFGEENNEAYKLEFDDSNWADFQIGDYWGGYDKGAWFRTKVTIPQDWKDKRIVLRFLVGPRDGGGSTAETLLYVNGTPLQGIDVWHEEAWLPPEFLQENEITIALKAWSSVLEVPERRCFKLAQIALVDGVTEKYYFLADTVFKAVQELDENDMRYMKLLNAVNDSLLKVDFLKPKTEVYYESIYAAYDYLKEQVEKMKEVEEIKPKVTALGHSHIDMAWLWTLAHSREKASRTFSTVLHLMRQYPEYQYIHTSPQLYKYLKEDYPEIYEKVKERIVSGEWEITGGMWIEPDTNVPNGESLIRQIMFGKRFMKKEFGVDTKVVWLPDVFGYSWALPQIMRKSGIETFMTTKISWSQYNRFPHDTFHWRGIDGTEILTHFITTPERGARQYTYNGMVEPYSVKGVWDVYQQKEVNDELLIAFGWGDGGGGPTKEMIESARVMKNIPGIPKVEMGKAEPYFERLRKRVKDKNLPVWDGELYLEYHRGTYTSQAALKRGNRKAEVIYHNAEWLNTLATLFTNSEAYPHQSLNNGWEKMLLNQFHDILPGSSIRQVNEKARADYAEVQEIGKKAFNEAKSMINDQIKVEDDSVVIYNSLSHRRDGLIEVPLSTIINENSTIVDENGNISAVQRIDNNKLLVEVKNVPALGYKAYEVSTSETRPSPLTVKRNYLENDYYTIEFNEFGQISSLYDKKSERYVLEKGKYGNVFQAFEDKPLEFDAWDIDLYYQEKMREVTKLIGAKVIEDGPIRGVLQLVWEYYDSSITQDITIYADSPRVDFRTKADWEEKQTLLKVAFPVNVRSTRATYDIQFGTIERPTHWNTSWDYARFEVPGQKWVDVSEGNYGVALLNDCKYGFDVKDNHMRLTLIKSSISPDETADRGTHLFTYSLLPHEGDWRSGKVVEEANSLNYPLIPTEVNSKNNGTLPSQYEFASVNKDNVIIETIKKAEDEDAFVIRVFESKQYRDGNVKITFAEQIQKAVECNLVEEGEQDTPYENNSMTFSIEPYEIKTYKVWFNK